MNPMTFGRQCLGHDVCCHVACRNILNGNETVLVRLSNKMIHNIDMFRSFVKAWVPSMLNISLVVDEEKLRIAGFIGLSKFIK